MLWITITFITLGTIVWYILWKRKIYPFLIQRKSNQSQIKEPNKFLRLSKALVILGISISAGFISTTNLAKLFYIRKVEGSAEWKESNGQDYLYVEANDYYSLGYLEGKKLSRQIRNMEIVLQDFFGFLPEKYRDLALKYEKFIPKEYKDEMKGMAEGASRGSGFIFTYKDILIQNLFTELIYGQYYPNEYPLGCSSVAHQNEKNVTYGQNFDFPRIIGKDQLFETVSWVHHKLKMKEKTTEIFCLRLGGTICTPIGKSKSGIYSLMNVIDCNVVGTFEKPLVFRFREIFEEAQTPKKAITILNNSPQTISYNLILGNRTKAYPLQFTPKKTKIYPNTTISQTNRFWNENWNKNYLNEINFSKNRQNNLESLMKGAIEASKTLTEEEAIEILSDGKDREGIESAILQSNKKSATLAFITNSYFGLGNMRDAHWGKIPI